MISSVRIEGYCGPWEFEMSDLGRIDLPVGGNNSGKTSVVEAISLLSSAGDPLVLSYTLWRCGERLIQSFPLVGERSGRRVQPELDVARLFTGHEVQPGSMFRLSTTNSLLSRQLEFSITEASPRDQVKIFGAEHLAQTLAPYR